MMLGRDGCREMILVGKLQLDGKLTLDGQLIGDGKLAVHSSMRQF
jgi:hypothetical protein